MTTEIVKNPFIAPRPYIPATRKLKILLISHTCQSRTEGQPKAHALAALSDVELHLLTPQRWMHYGKWRDAEAPVDAAFQSTIAPVRFAWAGPAQYFFHYYPSLPRILKSFRPDVIDLWEEPWSLVSAHTCYLRSRLLPSAKVISETEQNINKVLPFPFEGFRRYTLRHADYAVGRNAESIEVLRAKGYSGPAEVVPNAVDTLLFRPGNRQDCRKTIIECIEKNESRKLAIDDPFFAGYAGRLVEEKGLMDLIDALPHASPKVHLLLLGNGPHEPALRQRAIQLNLDPRIHFFPARPLEQLPEFMNALDVFVLPSRTTSRWKEQFGRVIIEAHACGVPVIGSNSGAIPDVVADAGLVVREKNPLELAAAVSRLAEDPIFARQLGERGLQNARDYFTWEKVAERMATIYQTVTQ